MTTLINILAHKEAQQTFERHFQFWEKVADKPSDILVWCPSNSKVECPGIQILCVAAAQHAGSEAILRIRTILEHGRDSGYDRVAFFEYDSICLGDKLPEFSEDIGANIFLDTESDKFNGGMFTHPPVVVKREGLARLCEAFKSMSLADEGGFWDRWLGLAIKRAALSHRNFLSGEGFSRNTIHGDGWQAMREFIIDGATMIHGIKDKETLEVAVRARQLAFYREELKKEGLL